MKLQKPYFYKIFRLKRKVGTIGARFYLPEPNGVFRNRKLGPFSFKVGSELKVTDEVKGKMCIIPRKIFLEGEVNYSLMYPNPTARSGRGGDRNFCLKNGSYNHYFFLTCMFYQFYHLVEKRY